MNIDIKNMGIIDHVNIELADITVLTGYNDSGKSTISKVIYSLYKGINYEKENLKKDIIDYIFRPLNDQNIHVFWLVTSVREELLKLSVNDIINHKDKVKKIIIGALGDKINSDLLDILDEHLQHISQKAFMDAIRSVTMTRTMQSALDGQINNVYLDNQSGMVSVNNKINSFDCEFISDGNFYYYHGALDLPPVLNFSNTIYIESPVVLTLANSSLNEHTVMPHTQDLIKKLRNQWPGMKNSILEAGIVMQNTELISKINSILNGNIKLNNSNLSYYKNDGKVFGIGNVANGLKTYGIIKRLLDNGWLDKRSLLIIDEPEVHLHPEWQLKFAEILVLLSKTLQIKLLLTTNSPYFLQAIDAYSKKYKMIDNKFYWISRHDNGATAECINGKLDIAYNTLAKPMDDLMMLFEDIENDN